MRAPFYQIGSNWYTWVHLVDNQVHRMTAPALTGPWTDALGGLPDLSIQTSDEGANFAVVGALSGQVADPFVLQVSTPRGNKTFLYYTASQVSGTNYYEVQKLAIADMPVAQVVQTNGGDDIGALDHPTNLPIFVNLPTRTLDFQGWAVTDMPYLTTNQLNVYTAYAAPPVNLGCFVAQGCSNGTITLQFGSAYGGTQATGSLIVSPAGGAGITFQLPRNVGTAGYLFQNNGGTSTLFYMDSTAPNGSLILNPNGTLQHGFIDSFSSQSVVASAATISPGSKFFHVNGTTTITTIVPPSACTVANTMCQLTLIPDALWATATGGNIALASTALVNKALLMTYDPSTSLWYPSY